MRLITTTWQASPRLSRHLRKPGFGASMLLPHSPKETQPSPESPRGLVARGSRAVGEQGPTSCEETEGAREGGAVARETKNALPARITWRERRKSAHGAADATSAPRSAPRGRQTWHEAPPSGAERREGLEEGGGPREGARLRCRCAALAPVSPRTRVARREDDGFVPGQVPWLSTFRPVSAPLSSPSCL